MAGQQKKGMEQKNSRLFLEHTDPLSSQKAGMVFLDIISNLWHLAKLKSLALVCTLGYEKGARLKGPQKFVTTGMTVLRQNQLESISKDVLDVLWQLAQLKVIQEAWFKGGGVLIIKIYISSKR